MILYFKNNIYLNILNLLVVTIYAIILNKEFLLSTCKVVKNKVLPVKKA